jgi:hypothetical protein
MHARAHAHIHTHTHTHTHTLLLPCNPPSSNFYERLKDVRDYHRRFPVHDVTGAEDDSAAIKEEPAIPFTGEEGLGR